MSTEYYDPQVLERSRRLYEQIRPWVWGRSELTRLADWFASKTEGDSTG